MPAATAWACGCWNWATWSRPGWTCARPRSAPMRELHKLTHQPVNLSMRQGDEIVYIERTYSEHSGMQVVRAVGGRAPLHLTSVGKLFLAHGRPAAVRAYATRTGLAGHTRNSITDLPAWNASWPAVRAWARRATTRSWNWACAAWRPASTTTRASCGRAVDLGAGRPAGRSLAGAGQGHRRADLGGTRAPGLKSGRRPAAQAPALVRSVGRQPGPRRRHGLVSHLRMRSASPMRE
jgi:hypothetical protein